MKIKQNIPFFKAFAVDDELKWNADIDQLYRKLSSSISY